MNETATDKPGWLNAFDEEDFQFLKRFVLASGSLKEIATQYGVSYPTIRIRLDRLIAKIQAMEDPPADEFELKIRMLVADSQISIAIGKELLTVHRASLRRRGKS